MKIIISPYSVKLMDKENAKNYPYWQNLVDLLNASGHKVTQLHCCDEKYLEGVEKMEEMPLYWYGEHIPKNYDTFISVDNFFPHLMAYYGFSGYVIFGKSDPKIFGRNIHVNLLKDRKFLRKNQFDTWFNERRSKVAFLSPKDIMLKIEDI